MEGELVGVGELDAEGGGVELVEEVDEEGEEGGDEECELEGEEGVAEGSHEI